MIIDSPIISGSYLSTGSLSQTGNVSITGSLTATAGISGSFSGSGANLFGIPASGITGLNLSQIISGSVSASISPNLGLLINTSVSASNFTGSFTGSLVGIATSASFAYTASSAVNASASLIAVSASYAATASYLLGYISPFPFTGSAQITGSLGVTGSINSTGNITAVGTITAQTLVVQTITSSIEYSSGSNIFGSQLTNTQTFTGSVNITGSAVNLKDGTFSGSGANLFGIPATGITGLNLSQISSGSVSASISPNFGLLINTSVSASNFTGSLFGTSSIAVSSSYAYTASSAINTATLNGTGSVGFATTASFTTLSSSFQQESSSQQQVSASYIALSASYNTFSGSASTRITTISSSQQDISASQQQISASLLTVSRSYASTGSNTFVGLETITGSLIVTGSVAISTLVTSSGVRYVIADQNGLVSAQTASAAIFTTQQNIASAGQTVFPITNGYVTDYVTVFVNGTKLANDEFTDNDGLNITFLTGSAINDVVEFQRYLPAAGVSNNVLRTTNYFTTTLGQTNFTVNYTPGLLDVFYNGSKLNSTEYTAANGTSITLATGSNLNDSLEVDVYSYQVGAFSGIGGVGVAKELAFYNTTNSITGSNKVTYDGSTFSITGSFLVTGSSTFTNIGPAVFSGSVTAVGGFSGSFSGNADSASLAQNSLLLQGTGSVGFTTTASLLAVSSSQQQISASQQQLSSSFLALTASFNAVSASQQQISASLLNVVSIFATTGSNSFRATQSITGSLTVTGQIIAQTINVQQVTSSIIYSSGSNVFGCDLNSRQTFTGSVNITGSLTIGGVITSTMGNNSRVFLSNTATTGYVYTNLINTTGNFYTAIEGSTPNTFNPGTTAYASMIGTGTATDLQFYTNNTLRLTITSSGNIGIGTATPSGSLHIYGSTYASSRIYLERTSGAVGRYSMGVSTANNQFEITDEAQGNCTRFSITSTGASCFTSTLTAGGNIQTNGSANLYVKSTGFISNQLGRLTDFASSDAGFYAISGGGLQFVGGGCDRMTLTCGGSLGIGTSSPNKPLDVRGDAVFYACNTAFSEGISVFANMGSTSGAGINFHCGCAGVLGNVSSLKSYIRLNQTGTCLMFATYTCNTDLISLVLDVPTGNAKFNCGLTAKTIGTNDLMLNNLNYECANYVDGTRGSWLIQEGACDLFIINQMSCKKYKFNLIEIK